MHCEHIYPLMEGVCVRVFRRKPYLNETSLSAHYPGITFIDLPSTRVKGFEAVFHTFLSACRCIITRPDVVHVHNIGPGMFAPLLRLFGLRVVLTYHSANYEHAKWGAVSRMFLRACERISLRFANRVIFVNKFRMARFPQRVRRKSVYIPNGITPGVKTADTSFLERNGVEPGKYILAVGRLTPEKGFDHLIRAVNRLDEEVKLVIAGASDHDPSYIESLRALDTKGRVVFTGFTAGDDLRQLYSHARLFVLSSLAEGFPLVLLEAMSYGCDLIASDIDATHLIELPAENYFKPGDADDLARCLTQHLASPQPIDMHFDLAAYDWKRVANETQRVLTEA